MEERYIASVDLGTYKIAVCVAKILGQNVEVIYYKESPSDGIRYSHVFNPKKVETTLRQAISEAQNELKIKIHQVIVGLPRYYVRQESASASTIRTDQDSQITEEEVQSLKSMALESYPLENDNEVLFGAVAQSFSTEENLNELENDIIGMTASKLEGNFKVFIGNRRQSINIDNVFNAMNIAIAKKYFTPGITARCVLKEEQMENGVALLDIGGGVSSVTIFKGKIMRYFSAIPFGGNNITKDIKTECNISYDLAENIKMAYGACMPNKLSTLGEKTIRIKDDNDSMAIQVTVKYLSEIVSARMKEIIEALLYKIQESGYANEDDLRAGVVITGGSSELINLANYVKELSGYSVKIANPRPFFSCQGCELAGTGSAATTMGMIMAAKTDKLLNCTTVPVIPPKPVKVVAPKVEPQPEVKEAPEVQTPIVEAPTVETPAVQAPAVETAPEPVQEAQPAFEPQPYEEPVKESTESYARKEESSVNKDPFVEMHEPEYNEPEPKTHSEENSSIEDSVSKGIQSENGNKKKEKDTAPKKKEFSWIKHFTKEISNGIGKMFDDMNNETV